MTLEGVGGGHVTVVGVGVRYHSTVVGLSCDIGGGCRPCWKSSGEVVCHVGKVVGHVGNVVDHVGKAG